MKLSTKNLKSEEILTFDEVLERRLSAGRYQWLAMFFLCFVDLNDGVELLAMSLILPIVKREWQLSSFEVELLSSVFYLGGMVGSQIAGSLADRYGRRNTIIYASMVQFIVAFSFFGRMVWGLCWFLGSSMDLSSGSHYHFPFPWFLRSSL